MKARWPRPEFLAMPARPPALAWFWAATGALVLGVMVADAVGLQRQIDEQGLRLSAVTQRTARSTPLRSVVPVAVTSAADSAQAVRAAQQVAHDLAHPWGAILASVESETPAGLQWLLLDHAVDSPDLRLEGLAPDVASVMGLVDALSARVGWSNVVASRLQAPDAREPAASGPRWRFELSAVVNAKQIDAAPTEAAR
jgi:hypothetical protein